MKYPFTFAGRRCQIVAFLGGVSVRVRFADATALETSEGIHEATVSCLDLKTFGFVSEP